jgi:hypothetical protein
MKFSFDKPTIRLYRYYFLGLPKPIIIQAYDKVEARATIDRIWKQLSPDYQKSRIIGETVSVPIFGVSKRTEGDKTYVWVGKEYSSKGWMESTEFEKKFSN